LQLLPKTGVKKSKTTTGADPELVSSLLLTRMLYAHATPKFFKLSKKIMNHGKSLESFDHASPNKRFNNSQGVGLRF